MFQRTLPSGIKLQDIAFWLDGQDGGFADRKSKTAYTPTSMTKGVNIKGGIEMIFDGAASLIAGNALGNINTITAWIKPTSGTNYLFDLDGASNVSLVNGDVTTTSITSPTIYVNGLSGNTACVVNDWNFIVVTFETAVNATAFNIGKISTNFFAGSMTKIMVFNKVLTSNQIGQLYNEKRPSTYSSRLVNLLDFGNLKFFKDYENNKSSANADWSSGSSTATVTVTRDATHPATYFTGSGVMNTTTTSSVARFTTGFYDSTGFVSRAGLLIEAASVNLVPKSSIYNDASWVATTMTVTDVGGIMAPDGTSSSTLTASAGNATVLLAAAVTAQTYSVWIQRKTGSGNIQITADGGATYSTVTLVVGTWARFQISAVSALQTCGIRIVTSGDAIYVYGSQFENLPYSSSYIPTTSVALTRNAEKVSYVIASNRTPATESLFVKATNFNNTAGFIVDSILLDTDTTSRKFGIIAANDSLNFYPNITDSGTSLSTGTTDPVLNTSYVYSGIAYGTAAATNSEVYVNGTSEATNTTDYTSPAWGTNFYVGSLNDGTVNWNGIISSVTIYSDAKAVGNVSTISTLLSAA